MFNQPEFFFLHALFQLFQKVNVWDFTHSWTWIWISFSKMFNKIIPTSLLLENYYFWGERTCVLYKLRITDPCTWVNNLRYPLLMPFSIAHKIPQMYVHHQKMRIEIVYKIKSFPMNRVKFKVLNGILNCFLFHWYSNGEEGVSWDRSNSFQFVFLS